MYHIFDIDRFLKDSKTWDIRIKKLKAELEAIPVLKAHDGGGGKSATISDPTAMTTIQREKIISQIERLEDYKNALQCSINALSEDSRDIIQLFYFSRGYIAPLIEEYASNNAICISYVYTRRRKALDELADIVTTNFDIE